MMDKEVTKYVDEICRLEKININKIEIISKKNNIFVVNVNNKYIIKIADNLILSAEKFFFDFYVDNVIYERIVSYNERMNYIIYEYVSGEQANGNIIFLDKIIDNIKNYKSISIDIWGDLNYPSISWYEFLKKEFMQKRRFMPEEKEKEKRVREAIEHMKQYEIDKKLIHGDLGGYNIISNQDQIKAIIDPRTIIGDPLYDAIFFIFSSKKMASRINFENLMSKIEQPIEKIKDFMWVILYNRIAVEKKHGQNVQIYEEIWNNLNVIIKEIP